MKEMAKWRLVTYLAVPVCVGTAIYDLSGGVLLVERLLTPLCNVSVVLQGLQLRACQGRGHNLVDPTCLLGLSKTYL